MKNRLITLMCSFLLLGCANKQGERNSVAGERVFSEADVKSKSGIMLGLGETKEEVLESLDDLRSANVSVLTLGQYLQPTKNHLPVIDYITPEVFAEYKSIGLAKGFKYVESGPLVRSSYHAEKHLD